MLGEGLKENGLIDHPVMEEEPRRTDFFLLIPNLLLNQFEEGRVGLDLFQLCHPNEEILCFNPLLLPPSHLWQPTVLIPLDDGEYDALFAPIVPKADTTLLQPHQAAVVAVIHLLPLV